MKNKIVAIQGDNLTKLNYQNDTTILLAIEAQIRGAIRYFIMNQKFIYKK